ncbi:MAG TPA: hypothetical protein DDW50_07505 [Firmicutes bacterium]|nr:hypothetical protein [Bacillota bacterium]
MLEGTKYADVTKLLAERKNQVIQKAVQEILQDVAKQGLKEVPDKVAEQAIRKVVKESLSELEKKTGKKISKEVLEDITEKSVIEVKQGVLEDKGPVAGRDIRQIASKEVNAKYPENYETPYKLNTNVTEFTTTSETDFVRVHGLNNRERSWLMKKSEIEGLTPEQIKDKFALPETPTLITEVKVPPNTRMRVGEASGNKFGHGGGTQYELLERLVEPDAWQNTRKIGD